MKFGSGHIKTLQVLEYWSPVEHPCNFNLNIGPPWFYIYTVACIINNPTRATLSSQTRAAATFRLSFRRCPDVLREYHPSGETTYISPIRNIQQLKLEFGPQPSTYAVSISISARRHVILSIDPGAHQTSSKRALILNPASKRDVEPCWTPGNIRARRESKFIFACPVNTPTHATLSSKARAVVTFIL